MIVFVFDPIGKEVICMFKELKGYVSPSATVFGDDYITDLITTSSDVEQGVGDNGGLFPVD